MKVIIVLQEAEGFRTRGVAEDATALHAYDLLRLFIGAAVAAGFAQDTIHDAILEQAAFLTKDTPS